MNRLLAFVYAVCAIAFLIWASGCTPTLSAQTLPPPGRTAAFHANDGHYDLEISQGVAIAISCYYEGACKDVVVSTSDAKIADVHAASVTSNALGGDPQPYYSLATTSQFVVVGKQPGKAKIRVKTAKGGKTIDVQVIPAPAAGTPAVVAR